VSRFPWRVLREELIPEALRAPDPIAALEALDRESGSDGVVAEALGEHYELLGDLEGALRWYTEADRRYWDDRWKAGPRESIRRVRAALGQDEEAQDGEAPGTPDAEARRDVPLYVVGCTKSKVWDDPAMGDVRHVPAGLAYTGRSLSAWRASRPAREGARWLILSAKYGFIEPDHPIARYDVTFADPGTGPIDDESLRAQVRHQTRWVDATPLASFRRVVVVGSAEYLRRTEVAFAAVGAEVEPWPGTVREPGADGQPADRVSAVTRVLAALGPSVFDSADRLEPEWPVLERIAGLSAGTDIVLTLALALSDYQLGSGKADAYWAEAGQLVDEAPPTATAEVMKLMDALMQRPVAARLATDKLKRVQRLLTSGIPAATSAGVERLGEAGAEALWEDLGRTFGGRHAKTVVFAMKTVGLLHLCATGSRLMLPADLPIPVDLRVARISVASGLIPPPTGMDVAAAMRSPGDVAERCRGEIIAVWRSVADGVGLVAPRLDSLLWQVAEPLQDYTRDPPKARTSMVDALARFGAPVTAAEAAVTELTYAL
jgi:N-glycosylase/DNA lyase